MVVEIQGLHYTVATCESQTFRCGKTVTTVVLRSLEGDTEISLDTAKDWMKILGAKNVDNSGN